jgi:hypothetical protein
MGCVLHWEWIFSLVTVKCQVVHTTKAYSRSRCIARLTHLGIRWRWVVDFMLPLLYPRGKSLWYPLSRGWLGARAFLDVLEERNMSCLCWQNHGSSSPCRWSLWYNLWPVFVHNACEEWDTYIVQCVFVVFLSVKLFLCMLPPVLSVLEWDMRCQN